MHNGLRLRPGLDEARFDTACARQRFICLRSTCLREGILPTGLPYILTFDSMLSPFFLHLAQVTLTTHSVMAARRHLVCSFRQFA